MIVLKEKHLIALDLDGTLLTDDKVIAPESRQVIRHLMDQGHVVVIATGRTNQLSINYYKELGLTTPCINSNGAVMHHPMDKNWGTHHMPLQLHNAMEIIETCYHFQAKNILAAVQDHIYLDKFDQRIADFYGHKGESDSFVIGNMVNQLKEDPTVMLLYPDETKLEGLTTQLHELNAEVIDYRSWGEPFHVIEVMNKQMNKAEALKQLADAYGIPQQRIIAFGDGSNDLEMIDYAGVGVAMENAIDDLKGLAKYHTSSNEAHGVASFLTDFFKIRQPLGT